MLFHFFVGLLTGVYAQKSEISINLELLTVVQSDYRPLALRKVKGDTIPVRMIFFFRVINHTNSLFCLVLILGITIKKMG